MTMWHNNLYEEGIWDYNLDSFYTREEAIANGVKQYKDAVEGGGTDLFYDCDSDNVPTVFYIGEENKWNPHIDTDFILEQLQEDAYYNCGEVGDDCVRGLANDAYKSLDKKLQEALNSWLEEYGLNNLYGVINTEKIDVNDYL